MLANVSTVGLVGCASEGPSEDPAAVAADVHPDAMPAAGAGSALTELERDLLARAKGREWVEWSAADVDAFLAEADAEDRALLLWDPSAAPGAEALGRFAEEAKSLGDAGAHVVIAVYAGGDEREERIALRESQIPVDAVRIPRSGHRAQGLPGGEALLAERGTDAVSRVPLAGLSDL